MTDLSRKDADSAFIVTNSTESLSTGIDVPVCLNFKVPLRVRQQFKARAAQQNTTMTQMLLRMIDDALGSDASPQTNNEIKK
jgi:hypothetical protein